MSEEADAIVWSLQWLARCLILDKFIVRGRTFAYQAYYCRLDTHQPHYLFYTMVFPQELTPPKVTYFSPNYADECEKFNNLEWVKERGEHGEVLT